MGAAGRKEKSCSSSIKLFLMVMLLAGVFVDETEAAVLGIPCLTWCYKHCNEGIYKCTLKCAPECVGHFKMEVAPSPEQQRAFQDYIDETLSEGPSPQ